MATPLRFPYVMFRLASGIALAFIASCSLAATSAHAEPSGASLTAFEHALASREDCGVLAAGIVGNPVAAPFRVAGLAGASDAVAGYATGTGGPAMAFVASRARDGDQRWSEAAWLAIMARFAAGRDGSPGLATGLPPGTVYFFMVDDDARAAAPQPGDPLVRNLRLRDALVDLGIEAVVLLDFSSVPLAMTIRASSWRRSAPRYVLEAVRAAGRVVGVYCDEVPIADFYASAGLSTGSAKLSPWLDAGVPAVVLESGDPGTSPPQAQPLDIGSFAVEIARVVLGDHARTDPGAPGDDVSYLRYPLPFGTLTMADSTIVSVALAELAAIAAALAMGWLKGGRRSASIKAVASEAFAAYALSLTALVGSRALTGAAMTAWKLATDTQTAPGWNGPSLTVALALILRAMGAISVYYATSGIASRIGLFGDHRRIDAARAALALLCVDTIISVAVFPAVAPFLLVAVALSLSTSGSAVAASLGLAAVAVVALPFFDPRVVASIGDSSGGAGSVASAMLQAGLRGAATTAAFAAPFGLWITAASSPALRLRRGRRTALFWILGALACAIAETAVTLSSGTP